MSHCELVTAVQSLDRPGMGTTPSDDTFREVINELVDCFCEDGCHAAEVGDNIRSQIRAEFMHN